MYHLYHLHGTDLTMTLQIKLENIFKNLVETERKFGPDFKFIGLKVNNLDGSESNDDGSGKVYLGDLKIYHLLENKFKNVDLFIKIESKASKRAKDFEGQIIYDFKFNNVCVGYKYILPILNDSFKGRNKDFVHSLRHLRLNEEENTAYTIAQFKNDTRYKEVGDSNKIKHRHSWNPSEAVDHDFFTIRPNSSTSLEKCDNYLQTCEKTNDEILNLFPRFFHGEISDDVSEDNIVVIENMLPKGFCTSRQGIFLDKENVMLTLKALGKFHASSYITKNDNPIEFQNGVRKLKATGWTVPKYWDIYPNFLDEHLLRGMKFLAEDEKYEKKLNKLSDKILKDTKKFFFSLLETDESLAVICHGDFCKNNILYKHNSVKSSNDILNEPIRQFSSCSNYMSNESYIKKQGRFDKAVEQTSSITRIAENSVQNNKQGNKASISHVLIANKKEKQGMKTRSDENEEKYTFSEFNEAKENHISGHDEVKATVFFPEYKEQNKLNKMETHSSDVFSDKRKEFLNHILGPSSLGDKESTTFKEEKIKSNTQNHIPSQIRGGSYSIRTLNEEFLNHEVERTNVRNDETMYVAEQTDILLNDNFTARTKKNEDNSFKKPSSFIINHQTNNLHVIKSESIEPNHNNLISSDRKIICNQPDLKHSISLNDSYFPHDKVDVSNRTVSWSELNSSVTTKEEISCSRKETNGEDSEIMYRLNILEDKYKELERIYHENQVVLERRRVNNKIIQKLNEKKVILEEICKRIENINTKQEIENKIEKSIFKLYQNLDDLKITKTQNSKPQPKGEDKIMKTPVPKKTITEKNNNIILVPSSTASTKVIHGYVTKADKVTESKKQSLQRSQNLSNYQTNFNRFTNKKDKKPKNVDEQFDNIYNELCSQENLTEYESLFTELSQKDSGYIMKSQDNLTFQNDMSYFSDKGPVGGKSHAGVEMNKNKTSKNDLCEKPEYYTLSVKQRRDNLERTISLENKFNSIENSRKDFKRSNTEMDVRKITKPLISERNIILQEDNRSGESERESLKKDLLSTSSKSRVRFFMGSSFSMNEDIETEEDEIFAQEQNRAGEVDISTMQVKVNDGIKKTSSLLDLEKQSKRPVPMRRTISLAPETKGDFEISHEESERRNERSKEYFSPLITEPLIRKKHVSMLGVTDDDEVHIKTQKAFSRTLPRTEYERDKNRNDNLNGYRENGKRPTSAEGSQTLPRSSKRTTIEPNIEKKDNSMSTQLVFFDLARMIYASPVIDLSFFLFLNVSHELRVECWDEFISTYYSSMVDNTPSHISLPSRNDLESELRRKALYGYFLCCFFLPWMMEEHPHEEVEQWIHHGGEEGTRAVGNILKFLIDRDFV